MEGERILKELLQKKLVGLYEDTQNYIANLKRVAESKNGYTAKGCSSVEKVVSKYGGFCNKFLRCAIEVIKGSEDAKDLEEIMMTVNMVMNVLDLALTTENGKYLKFMPSLDEVCRKILHITSHLLNKNVFNMSLSYIDYCIKYLRMARDINFIENCKQKDFQNIALHMANISWKGAQQLEQSISPKEKSKEKQDYVIGCKDVLKFRLRAVIIELEACFSILESLISKAVKSITKFQMDIGSSRQCVEESIALSESVFHAIKDKALEQSKCGEDISTSPIYSTFDLGLHIARMCNNLERTDKANFFFEELQNLTSEVVKPRKKSTAEGCTILRFVTFNISITKAAMLFNTVCKQEGSEESQKSDNLVKLEKMLDEGRRLLNILMGSKTRTLFPLTTILQTLELLKSSLQNVCNFTKEKDGSAIVLPYKTFESLELLLEEYEEILHREVESTLKSKKSTNMSDASLFQPPQQKLMDRMLALSSFIMRLFLHQIQLGFKKMTDNSVIKEMMSSCIRYSHKTSTMIHSLMGNTHVCLSNNELMWHGSLSFSLGMEAYKCDLFQEGSALMSLGCNDLKEWSFSAGDDHDLVYTRLKELFPKYGALVDCKRRARCYEEAFDSATSIITLFIQLNMISKFSSWSTDLQKHIRLWLKTKNDLVKHSDNDNLSDIRSRTLFDIISNNEEFLSLTNAQLAWMIQEELKCYKAITTYNTEREQLSITKQIIDLYTMEQDSFNLAIAMLEHARVLHANGKIEYCDRSPLDLCQESLELLEGLQNSSVKEPQLVTLQDKIASAYLWQCILQHEEAMRQNVSAFRDLDICESACMEDMEQEKSQQVICLEQPFVLSLHAAVDMWTMLVENWAKSCQDGKVDISALLNPTETCQYLQKAALLYGILNQPLNQVHALHLCAVINQAINTNDAVNNAVIVYAQAIHTLCTIHDIKHACLLLSYCEQIEEKTILEPAASIQLLLAKSHVHLESGKYYEGEKCLNMAFSSDFLSQKTCTPFVHFAVAHSLVAKYLQIPLTVYCFRPPQGFKAAEDHATPLDVAFDAISKLEGIAFTLFGQRISDLNTNTCIRGSGLSNTVTDNSHLLVVYNLLMFQQKCGSLLAHQGMVRQAIKYLTDGLVLSRIFLLPYRVVEFLTSLSLVKTQKGEFKQGKKDVLCIARTLAPILQSDEEITEVGQCLETPPLVEHPETCHCICCSDSTVQSILMGFFLAVAKYFESIAHPKDSIKALEITEKLTSNAIQRMTTSLGEFTNTLILGCGNEQKEDCDELVSRSKKRGKTAKAKQGKKDFPSGTIQDLSQISQAMFSSFVIEMFVLNAEILISNNKSMKALDVVVSGLEAIQDMKKVNKGTVPLALTHATACLYYIKGLVHFKNAQGANETHMDSIWGFPVESYDPGDLFSPMQSMDVEEEKPTKKGKLNSKTKSQVINENSVAEETMAKRGRGKKGTKTERTQLQESEHPKTSRKVVSRGGKKTKERIKELEQVSELKLSLDMFENALDLCCWMPQPKLFSHLCEGLTLCYGRTTADKAVHYLNMSLGITLRYEAANSYKKKIRKLLKEKVEPQVLPGNMKSLTEKTEFISLKECQVQGPSLAIQNLQETRQLMHFQSHQTQLDTKSIPKEWTVCTLVSVQIPGSTFQEMVIYRQRSGRKPILVKTLMNNEQDSDDSESHINDEVNKIVLDMAKLFQESIQDEFSDIMQSSLDSMCITDNKEWCQTRSSLDIKLKVLMKRLENTWLGMWKGVLLGQHANSSLQESLQRVSEDLVMRLQEYTGRPVDRDLTEVLVDSFHFLTAVQVREALSKITGLKPTSPVLDKVVEDYEKLASSLVPQKKRTSKERRCSIEPDRHPVVLILGKEIQHLPWENIPIMRDQQVTRMPSMHFVLAQTQKIEAYGNSWVIDPSNAYYVLNPDDNLPNTQKIFQNWFESELHWDGITGKKPSPDEYKSALVDHELFLYLGHGSGRSFFKGDDVQRIACRAITILMGCSSAKLMVDGVCEPRGMSLNYLLAGCPAIVGNLWDVTDRDIDRFTKSLLQTWLEGDHQRSSLLQFIKNARKACKLPYLIGASPVVYGVPVYVKDITENT